MGELCTFGALLAQSPQQSVTNIGQLFEALAEGWGEGSDKNRTVMGTEWDGDFIRVTAMFSEYPWYRKGPHDIAIEASGYSMRGFIRFEVHALFPDLFKTSFADDGVWYSASLTKRGAEFARAGLIAFDNSHRDIKRHAFFNPPMGAVEIDPRLPGPRALAKTTGAKQ